MSIAPRGELLPDAALVVFAAMLLAKNSLPL